VIRSRLANEREHQFSQIMAFLLKNQCYDHFLHQLAVFSFGKANFFAQFFGENIMKIITSVPGFLCKVLLAHSLHNLTVMK
jgi:hypothetical protein